MKVNELRIGNLFFDADNIPRKLIYMDLEDDYPEDETGVTLVYGNPSNGEYEWIEDVTPIPINEDWHNKFGVKISRFNNYEYIINDRKKIIFSGDYVYLRDIDRMDGKESMEDNICTLWNNDQRRRGIYVHEWQNLWYALTGEELIFKQ